MFLAKFKYENCDRLNYIYINKKNDLIGFSLDSGGLKPVEMELVNKFISIVHLNDKCVELLEENGNNDYTVYYDPKTKFKHYIKDGKEDFEMFFNNNGSNALLYEKGNGNRDARIVKFVALGMVFVIGWTAFNFFVSDSHIKDYITYKYFTNESYDNALDSDDPIADVELNGEMLTIDEAVELIRNSPYLDDDDKNILANLSLLEDVMPYYQGTTMQDDIKVRLKDISINYYDETDPVYTGTEMGYYSVLSPSVINLFSTYKDVGNTYEERKDVLGHEYIHLLSYPCTYEYIEEATTELMAIEYYDSNFDSGYDEGVKSLKLLIDIVGPEPILKGKFSGDYSDLESILSNNLSFDDYDKLMNYFAKNPSEVKDREPEIRSLLCKLYENMYGQDIEEDENILYDLLYKESFSKVVFENVDRRIYLNKSKMPTEENVRININYLMYDEPDNHWIAKEDRYVIRKKVGVDEYLERKNNGDDQKYEFESCMKNGNVVDDKFILYDEVKIFGDGICYGNVVDTISLDEAIVNGYAIPYIEDSIGIDEELPVSWEYKRSMYSDRKVITTYRSNLENAVVVGETLSITVPGIKERFNVNTRSIEDYGVSNKR